MRFHTSVAFPWLLLRRGALTYTSPNKLIGYLNRTSVGVKDHHYSYSKRVPKPPHTVGRAPIWLQLVFPGHDAYRISRYATKTFKWFTSSRTSPATKGPWWHIRGA